MEKKGKQLAVLCLGPACSRRPAAVFGICLHSSQTPAGDARKQMMDRSIPYQQRKPTTNAREFIFQTDPILPDVPEPPNILAMDYKLVTSLLAFCPVPRFTVSLARLCGVCSFSLFPIPHPNTLPARSSPSFLGCSQSTPHPPVITAEI